MLDRAARELFIAAEARDPVRLRASVARLVPVLSPPVRAAIRRQHGLLRRGRVDESDVIQRVFERLLTHPPDNAGDRQPAAVILAWAKAVALHHLLDLARRFEPSAAPLGDGEGGEEGLSAASAEPAAAPVQEEALERRERFRLACACADTDLGRHKHLREVFYALVEDPDLSAGELAARIGLWPPSGEADAARKAEQHVWKLRERVHLKLAECIERHERSRSRPQGGRLW